MMELELFQTYHLKEMSLSAELFLSCSILQFTFYVISTAYQRKAGFVVLNKQVYYISILFMILLSFLVLNEDLLTINSFSSNNFIVSDYFGFACKWIICVTSIFFLLIINISFREEPVYNNSEYVILIIISILGLLLLCCSNDLITAYLAIELHGVAFYVMSAFKRDSSYSIESGLKYFIIGALSSALFLFGSAIVYGCMGSLNFNDLKLFFSLLFATKTEILFSFFSKTLENCSYANLSFCSYMSNDHHQSLASLLLEKSNIAVFSGIEPNTTDSLINWCIKNNFDDISTVFITNTTTSDLCSEFNVLELTQIIIFSSWFLTVYYGISCMLVEPAATFYSFGWFDLSTIYSSNPNTNTLLLKHISAVCNSSNANKIMEHLPTLNIELVSIGFVIICVSILIKLSIAPFHFWSLDVYEGSPNVTTFFFVVVPKIALFVILMRICYVSFYPIFIGKYQTFFLSLAVLSVFTGSFGGLEQRKLKTLLAYSSISHTGYLLLSFSTGSTEGMQMMFYYLVIYMISGLCFWATYLFLKQKRNFYSNKSNKELGDLVLLKKSNPMLALVLAITLFSIAGIPPIVGFLAKIGVFLIVIKSSAYLISVFSILFSVISTFYYIRLVKILYFENTLVGKLYVPITTKKALIVSVSSLLLIILCANPTIVYLLFYKATSLSG